MATQTIDPLAVVREFTTLDIQPPTLTSAVPACVEQWKKPDRPATASKGGRVTKNGKPRSIATSRSPSVKSSRSSPKTPSNVTTSEAMSVSSSSRSPVAGANSILPYRMHVSQRYLDLTRQKLGLTRLPREPRTRQQQWDLGVSKAVLEPLVDHWTDDYDWRAQEAFYNEALPQYRLAIHGTRMHFVHKRSMAPNAIPILIAQGWPESFVSVTNIIDSLCNPVSTPPRGDENVPSFHVVVPSIPGCGFSDPVAEEGNNITTTAEAFDALMKSLGYSRYIAHGTGWGFKICRMIALMHSESCMAVHTANPEVPAPQNVAYAPQSLPTTPLHGSPMQLEVPGMTPPRSPGTMQQQPRERPQTLAYALCDSPTGLLAYMVEAIKPRLPPPETEEGSASPHPTGLQINNSWTLTNVLDWAMLYWLPGPEVALRWLMNSTPMIPNLWLTHSNVPLAVSQFGDHQNMSPQPQPMWIEAYHRIAMVRRRPGQVRFAAWERPMDVVHDIRDLAGLVAPSFFGGGFAPYGQGMS